MSCTRVELYTLVSLLGGGIVIGLPDPFPGWLIEEISEATRQAKQKLMNRQWLRIHSDGQLVVDFSIAAMVCTIVEPQAVVLLTRGRFDEQLSRQWAAYLRPPLLMWMEEDSDEELTIEQIEESTLPRRILENWTINAQLTANSVGSVVVPLSAREAVLQLRQRSEKAIYTVLRQYGAPAKEARALSHGLSTARQNGAMIVLQRQKNIWTTSNLGILEGENGLWLLHITVSGNTPFVEFTPAPACRVEKEIITTLLRAGFIVNDGHGNH